MRRKEAAATLRAEIANLPLDTHRKLGGGFVERHVKFVEPNGVE